MHDVVDVPIQGTCAPEYPALHESFAENSGTRGEIGAAVWTSRARMQKPLLRRCSD
jgi:hypothetical protein